MIWSDFAELAYLFTDQLYDRIWKFLYDNKYMISNMFM